MNLRQPCRAAVTLAASLVTNKYVSNDGVTAMGDFSASEVRLTPIYPRHLAKVIFWIRRGSRKTKLVFR